MVLESVIWLDLVPDGLKQGVHALVTTVVQPLMLPDVVHGLRIVVGVDAAVEHLTIASCPQLLAGVPLRLNIDGQFGLGSTRWHGSPCSAGLQLLVDVVKVLDSHCIAQILEVLEHLVSPAAEVTKEVDSEKLPDFEV